jgi:hypothetical protein
MIRYGTLRVWAGVLSFFGWLMLSAALFGTIVLAIEVNGSWRTVGVVLFGSSLSIFLWLISFALAQALRALADVGEIISAR